jgi:hypothetical protein
MGEAVNTSIVWKIWWINLFHIHLTPAIVRLEGLGQLKNSTSSELEPATFRLVARCLNQLRYSVCPIDIREVCRQYTA